MVFLVVFMKLPKLLTSKFHTFLQFFIYSNHFFSRRTAHFCVFATACDEPSYEKLVRALCKQHGIPIFEVEDKAQLGEWVGQCKYDKEGQARKVVGCSCAVVRAWGRDEEAKKVMEEYFASHRS